MEVSAVMKEIRDIPVNVTPAGREKTVRQVN